MPGVEPRAEFAMPTYVAKIRDTHGNTREESVTVPREEQLSEYLSRLDGYVLECTRTQPGADSARPTKAPRSTSRLRTPKRDLVLFSSYLHTMLEAGVPLVRSLQIVRNQLEHPAWSQVIDELDESLRKGESFSDALARFPRCFPRRFLQMIEVGELSGQLDLVLGELTRVGEKEIETRGRLIGALAYPTLLVAACGGVVVFLIAFVLPKIARMFTNTELELPLITKVMLGAGDLVRNQILPVAALCVMTTVIIGMAATRPGGRRWISLGLLHAPLFGQLYRKVAFGAYSRTLAMLTRSGISLMVGLDVARRSVSNVVLREFFLTVENNLRDGASLGEELARSSLVPEMVISMISVGEETGRMADMLENVSRFYERDLDRTIQVLPKLVEPMVIVGMTGVVGLIAASVFVPLSQLTHGIGQ